MMATNTRNQLNAAHLTPEQMDALLHASAAHHDATAAEHLLACPRCEAEVNDLRAMLGSFRTMTTELAEKAAMQRPRTNLLPARSSWGRMPLRSVPAYFALAASLAVAAVLLQPVHVGHKTEVAVQPAAQPAHSIESDEALLRDIDQQLDASVPAAMEPLANPSPTSAGASGTRIKDTKDIKKD